jgi:hypothetical protein
MQLPINTKIPPAPVGPSGATLPIVEEMQIGALAHDGLTVSKLLPSHTVSLRWPSSAERSVP